MTWIEASILGTVVEPSMNWLQAFILGIVEGLTEYLPVSSTGHLIVVQRFMGIGLEGKDKAAADCFAICIQAGAIMAVLGLYWPRVKQMILGVLGKDAAGLRLTIALVAGFLPAAVIGLAANDWIEARLFGLKPVVAAWLIGGVAILFVDRWMKRGGGSKGVELAEITVKMAVIIGFAQCVAMWPGTSRSLVTIVGGLAVGLSMAAAVEFSFLLGVITLLAATLYKSLGDGAVMVEHYGVLPLLLGTASAWLFAVISVRWMVAWLQRHGLELFGWYRVGLALVVGALLLAGWSSAA